MYSDYHDKELERFKAKWPGDVGDRGFAAIPKCILTCPKELGLSPLEVLVLANIIEKCWKPGEKAWFSIAHIVENTGRGPSTIKKTTASLEKKGYITKERQYYSTTLYDPTPAQKKLAEHLPHCKRWARNSAKDSQDTGSVDSQETGSYIEAEITRNNYLDINSQTSTNGGRDKTKIIIEGDLLAPCPATLKRHEWEDFNTDGKGKDGRQVTYYYRFCINCGMQFHKKGEPPWPGYYPHKIPEV